MKAWVEYVAEVYALTYLGVVCAVSLLEWLAPHQPAVNAIRARWLGNFGIMGIGQALSRALVPLSAIAWAFYCGEQGWGLFNQITAPHWLAVLVTVWTLDLFTYSQHYLMHRIPALWLIHRTHHSDLDCDFSTGLRFHPIEALIDTVTALLIVTVLGAPPLAVAVSQILSMSINFFEHANVRLPHGLERRLRLVVVTPDMHRIHHSRDGRDNHSNFGSVFPWWDRLLGTHQTLPAAGPGPIAFGVAGFLSRRHLTLPYMLAQPLMHEDEGDGITATHASM